MRVHSLRVGHQSNSTQDLSSNRSGVFNPRRQGAKSPKSFQKLQVCHAPPTNYLITLPGKWALDKSLRVTPVSS